MSKIVSRVRPPLRFVEPGFSPVLFRTLSAVSGLYLRLALKVKRIRLTEPGLLAAHWTEFFEGKTRLILAFRHAHVNDGPILFHLFSNTLPKTATRLGLRLPGPVHTHFVYARNVPVWSGAAVGWIFPRIGGVSVLKGKPDSKSIGLLRRIVAEGRFPLAIAPESQVTYHNDKTGPLDPGVSRLALWGIEDLSRLGSAADVRIVPVMNRYRYLDPGFRKVSALLARLEREIGLGRTGSGSSGAASAEGDGNRTDGDFSERRQRIKAALYARIERVTDRLLEIMERFYARSLENGVPPHRLPRRERIVRITDAALRAAESFFGLDSGPGTPAAETDAELLRRVLAVRTLGLSRIFREDLPPRRRLSALERALADRIAAESDMVLRHMELADILEYLDDRYLSPDANDDRFIETVLNLCDVASRLTGGNISGRPDRFRKLVEVSVGEPISTSAYLNGSGLSRREAADRLTEELGKAFTALAESGADGRRDRVGFRS
jgi:hypothetical protein